MKQFFCQEEVDRLHKLQKKVYCRLVIISVIFVILVALLLIFQNRTLANLFIVLLSLLTTLYLCYVLIEYKEVLLPIKNYKKEIARSLKLHLLSNTLIFAFKDEKFKTYQNIKCWQLHFIDAENKDKKRILYVPIDEEINLSKKAYSVRSYHNFIASIEEVK